MKGFLPNEADTVAMAERLHGLLPKPADGWMLLLNGELGAGKSTFARALIRAAGYSGPVPSPTYTLVEPYDLSTGMIYHIDLYRILDESELSFLGWNELDDGVRLVEWPERVPNLKENADLSLTLSYEGDGRSFELRGLSSRGIALAEDLDTFDSKD